MRGRKNKYEECVKPYLDDINLKVRQGIIEEEIAKALGISVATLNKYKKEHPEFKEALSKNKGKDVLQNLINAGIESSLGYYKDNTTTTETTDADGNVKITKTTTHQWYPANPTLHKFYVLNFGKDEGLVNDPLDYELKKQKQELDEELLKAKNWDVDFDNKSNK